ncbi:MAG: CPBP family intramembrane metalloprotease [Lachnospiraceae bacterium]|nr:CPBP family intramembrane metalloprotease [Lachnospiraceae bacterium]
MGDEQQSIQTKKRLTIFLILTFVFTYLYEFGILFPQWRQVRSIAALNVAPVMFIPAICALAARIITKEGFKDSFFNPKFRKGKRRYYLAAWFLPDILTILGVLLYFLIYKDNFSIDMEYYVGVLKRQGAEYAPEVARNMVLSSSLAGFFLAPVLNILTCFGEEWGFRAYLFPKLKGMLGLKRSLLLSGLIWGIWHMPLIIMGHNYGLSYSGYPVAGIFAMCAFCLVIGILFSYLFVRTGSVFAPVFAHGALNGFASFGIYFTKDGGNPFIGPSVTGIISGMPFIVCAVIAFYALSKYEGEAPEIAEDKLSDKGYEKNYEIRETQEKH